MTRRERKQGTSTGFRPDLTDEMSAGGQESGSNGNGARADAPGRADRNSAIYRRTENRTGVAVALEPVEEMIEGAQEFSPEPDPDDKDRIAEVRIEYARQSGPVGTMPELCTCAEDAEEHAQHVGPDFAILLDKLGERLAFERSGVRLYDALISKYDAYGSWAGGPQRIELESFREQELAHFHLLAATIDRLGGDPTAVTPSANVAAVASKGLMQVLTDPRTDLVASLEAILIAELADNDCWNTLSKLALGLGSDDLARAFDEAIENEETHLAHVRAWLAARFDQAAVFAVDEAEAAG